MVDPDTNDDPAVVGVPPETPDDVRPSATGLVAGPVDGETDVDVAEVHVGEAAQEDDAATMEAGGRVLGETDDGDPVIEGPNSA